MLELLLRPREERRLLEGHLWVFRDELSKVPEADPGTLARVVTRDGYVIGTGFYNPLSKIAVRLLGSDINEVDTAFFVERFTAAQNLRHRLLPGESAYRLIHGESDLLSGLIIDRYADVAVIQMLSAGMDRHRENIVEALQIVFPDLRAIVEKNTMQTRKTQR